jgi:hypothetical protein
MRAGLLKALPVREGAVRSAKLILAFSDAEFPGRDAARLAEILRARSARACHEVKKPRAARRR